MVTDSVVTLSCNADDLAVHIISKVARQHSIEYCISIYCQFGGLLTGDVCLNEVKRLTDGRMMFIKLECGPMPNLMVALPNIGGALCSTPQSLADAPY